MAPYTDSSKRRFGTCQRHLEKQLHAPNRRTDRRDCDRQVNCVRHLEGAGSDHRGCRRHSEASGAAGAACIPPDPAAFRQCRVACRWHDQPGGTGQSDLLGRNAACGAEPAHPSVHCGEHGVASGGGGRGAVAIRGGAGRAATVREWHAGAAVLARGRRDSVAPHAD